MTNIERIDQACWETYQRYQGRYSNPNKIYEHLSYALSEGLRSNFSGFTRQNGARELVMSMEPHEFEAEFLKSLVRSVAYKRETMDPESYDMERGQIGFEWMNYQPIRDAVISSFVHNRYERNISGRVNDSMLTPEEKELVNDIDIYSIRRQNGFHI